MEDVVTFEGLMQHHASSRCMPHPRLACGFLAAAAVLLVPGPDVVPAAGTGAALPLTWVGALLLVLAAITALAPSAGRTLAGGRD